MLIYGELTGTSLQMLLQREKVFPTAKIYHDAHFVKRVQNMSAGVIFDLNLDLDKTQNGVE